MGVVYRARDTKLERTVALKFLPQQWCQDDAAKQRFLREAQAASATNHRNICIIHDIEQTEDGQLFIVMAYYEGQTLKQRLEQGALPVAEAIEVAAEIAEGRAKAHAQGVVHRDIKPGNIMVTEDGVKILDFGLAKLADAAVKLTLEGSTLGTVAYMSPEQARGEEADERSDVWALGVVLYEMLTGRLPFAGDNSFAVMHAIVAEVPRPVSTLRHDAPAELAQLVDAALQKDRSLRTVTAADFATAITAYRDQHATLGSVRRKQDDPSTSRRTLKTLVTVAAIVAAAGGATWWTKIARPHWARDVAPLEIRKLADDEHYVAAFDEAVRAEAIIPNNPGLLLLWPAVARRANIKSTPTGADVYFREYGTQDAQWRYRGNTPLKDVRYPRGFFDWKLTLSGYADVEDVGPQLFGPLNAAYVFEKAAETPAGMVRASSGGAPFQI